MIFRKREKKENKSTILVTNSKYGSIDEFRVAITNIGFATMDDSVKTIGVTSSLAHEGKSTISANLAIAYAQSGEKTLLIDGDLHRPTVAKAFKCKNDRGLTTLIANDLTEKNQDIKSTLINNLFILTSGILPPDPAKFARSPKVKSIIDDLKKDYDVIIMDLPPMLGASETTILSSKLDAIILVVNPNVATKMSISKTKKTMDLAKLNILGYIYNDTNAISVNYDYSYGY